MCATWLTFMLTRPMSFIIAAQCLSLHCSCSIHVYRINVNLCNEHAMLYTNECAGHDSLCLWFETELKVESSDKSLPESCEQSGNVNEI